MTAFDETLTEIVSLAEALIRKAKNVFVDAISVVDSSDSKVSLILEDSFSLVEVISSEKKQAIRDMQLDFAAILSDVPFKESVAWSRATKTEDSMGRSSDSSSWTHEISLIIQPLTEKDRSIIGEGIKITSHMKAYSQWQYRFDGTLYKIETGDTIVRTDGKTYLVKQIVGKYGGSGLEVYRKLILREVDND